MKYWTSFGVELLHANRQLRKTMCASNKLNKFTTSVGTMFQFAHFEPWSPIRTHYFWPPMISSWISAMFKWIIPFPQNAFPSILSRYSQFSPILRRSRKLSCKKGGVDCRVSRREREIPNTFGPITELHLALANPFLRRKKNSDSRNNFTLSLAEYFF